MSSESVSRDQRLQEILAAYLQDVEAGKNPDREKLLAQHPDLADDLRSFLAENDKMRRLVDQHEATTLGPESSADARPPWARRSAISATTSCWRKSPAAAWAWFTRPGRSASTASSP